MAAAEDPEGGRAERPARSRPGGPAAPPSVRLSARQRFESLRERTERTRAAIEARRADSDSIATAFEAVERDAQTGGGVLAAALAFRLFMFLVPYAFVMVTGFGLASSAAGQDPRGRPLGRHRWPFGQRGRQHQHPLPVESDRGPVGGRVCVGPHGSVARPCAVDRPSPDLEGRVHPQTLGMGRADPRGHRHRTLRHSRPGSVAWFPVLRPPGAGAPPDRRLRRRRVVSGFVVDAARTAPGRRCCPGRSSSPRGWRCCISSR